MYASRFYRFKQFLFIRVRSEDKPDPAYVQLEIGIEQDQVSRRKGQKSNRDNSEFSVTAANAWESTGNYANNHFQQLKLVFQVSSSDVDWIKSRTRSWKHRQVKTETQDSNTDSSACSKRGTGWKNFRRSCAILRHLAPRLRSALHVE